MRSSAVLKTSLFLTTTVFAIIAMASFGRRSLNSQEPASSPPPSIAIQQPPDDSPSTPDDPKPQEIPVDVIEPISRASERVIKKPFGLRVTRENSPVSPERFSGYHAGVDFETFPDEQNVDVPVFAICSGPLVLKKRATGYGGVAVQRCTINDETVTVIYGHMRLASIAAAVNDQVTQGAQLGVLGTGFGVETDGERKHLHLGIHKGTNVIILGYVQSEHALKDWLDIQTLLK